MTIKMSNMNLTRLYFPQIIFLISFHCSIGQIDVNYRDNVKKAYAASSTAECRASLKFCNEVLKAIPDHSVMNYLSARLNAQLGNRILALDQLEKATVQGYTSKMLFHELNHLNDSAFNTLRETKKFKQIIKILKESEEKVHRSEIAFTIDDKKLNPEGIAYDPVEKMFYLGSIDKHKIVKVDHSGKSTDFTTEGQDGLKTVLGVHVDATRRTLWACSYSREIYKYDLTSGKLLKKYPIPASSGEADYFNDLVIHPNGDIYISGLSTIYTIPYSSDQLKIFLAGDSFVAFNGITLTEDGSTIYVSDYYIGIYKIDIRTKSFFLLPHEEGFNLIGVDGLYLLNNYLYAVQDVVNSVDRFMLNKDATRIKSCEFFERNSQYFNMPTTGVLVDDYFYFIADTQAKSHKQEGILIMRASIK